MNFSDVPSSGKCKQCAKPFRPHTPNDKYCTLGCRLRHDELACLRRNAEKKARLSKSKVSCRVSGNGNIS